MNTRYSTYILRCWHLPDGARRIAIQHVQSGHSASVATLAAAVDWLDQHVGGAPGVPPVAPHEGGTGPPEAAGGGAQQASGV